MGAFLGSRLPFNLNGLDFVVTALFLVIFISQLEKDVSKESAFWGIFSSIICLLIFGEKYFLLPSMIIILTILTIRRERLEQKVGEK